MKKLLLLFGLLTLAFAFAQNTTEQGPGSVENPNPTGYSEDQVSCTRVCRSWIGSNGQLFEVTVTGIEQTCDPGTSPSCLLVICNADCSGM
jgi:hypothetical protein